MEEPVNVCKQTEPAWSSECDSEDGERKYFNKLTPIFQDLYLGTGVPFQHFLQVD